MERKHLLMLVAVILIMGLGFSLRIYINQNVELYSGMTPEEYREKLASFSEREVSIEEINRSPEGFRGEEVIVRGQVDIALMEEDRYLVYPMLEREKKLYFTECPGNEPLGDSAYIRGALERLESNNPMEMDENLTEQERENIETTREAMEKYNYSVPEYMDNETEHIWGIECEEVLPVR
jgi:hypothetical protein